MTTLKEEKLRDFCAHSFLQLSEILQNHDVEIDRRAESHGGGFIVRVSLSGRCSEIADNPVVAAKSLREAIGLAWQQVTSIEAEAEMPDDCHYCAGTGIGQGDPDTSSCGFCHGKGITEREEE